MISKAPPHNLDAEQAVLGGIFLNNDAMDKIINIVSSVDFYREGHVAIFSGMLDLYEKSELIDFVTISELLREKKCLDKSGGSSYITSLIDNISTSAGITYHAKIIRDLSVRRRLITQCSNIIDSCFDKSIETEELVELAGHSVHEIAQVKDNAELIPMSEVIKGSVRDLEKAYESKGEITGLTTGFYDLDSITCGLQPSDLIILAGRPSMGKTALAINIAYNYASLEGGAVAVFSLEMSKWALGTRLMSLDSGVNSNNLRTGKLKDEQWVKLTDTADKLASLPIYIDDRSHISVLDMRSSCRKLIRKGIDIKMVAIDYIGLVKGRSGDGRQNEVSQISREMKSMAKDLGLPVIALSQLNRKVEDRPNKRPLMSDLRESGSLEQDADIVAFLYRDEQYYPDNVDNQGKAEVIIAKQRNGRTGKIDLMFKKEQTKFENLYKG